MAFEPGKGQVFKVDNSAGTLTDISAYLTDVDFPQEVDTEDVTTLGKSAKVYLVTLTDGTISVEGKWDGAASAVDVTLSGIVGSATTKTFEYGPGGSTTGDVKYTGECICTKYQIKGSVGGATEFSAEFQCSDTITRTTFA
jgi:hypothetical protein